MDTIAGYVMGMPFLTGLIFFLIALVTYFYPPKDINSLYGYRTSSSMKNQEQWNYAQRFCTIRMIFGGLFLMVVSLLKLVLVFSVDMEITLSLILVIGVAAYLIVATELAIKKNFPNEK